jgi:adenylyltransferase/sulfurtransferase
MPKAHEVPNCNEHGVLGILPGIIGNLQALEAVKVITGIGEVLSGTLLIYDALGQRIQRIKVPLDAKNLKITTLANTYALSCGLSMEEVPAEALRQHLAQDKGFLLDVRSAAEYGAGHIPGAINRPLSELKKHLGEVPTGAPVYVICQSGVRSASAVEQLKDYLPHGRFINVLGGMNQFNKHGATH